MQHQSWTIARDIHIPCASLRSSSSSASNSSSCYSRAARDGSSTWISRDKDWVPLGLNLAHAPRIEVIWGIKFIEIKKKSWNKILIISKVLGLCGVIVNKQTNFDVSSKDDNNINMIHAALCMNGNIKMSHHWWVYKHLRHNFT